MQLRFEWDKRKAEINLRKHGISFDDAQSVFTDDLSIAIADPDHSGEEERSIIMGISRSGHARGMLRRTGWHHSLDQRAKSDACRKGEV